MARWRPAIELAMTDEEIGSLTTISRSRTEPARRVERAQMLLAYRIEGFFSRFARSFLRHIRVASRQETEGAHHGRYRVRQSLSRHPLLVLQTRRGRPISI